MGSVNVTLYAKWDKTYTVFFDSRGGSNVGSQTVIEGEKATQPAAPTWTGCFFKAWYIDSTYTTLWNFNTDVVTSDVTLYAKWVMKDYEDNEYTVVKIGNQVWMAENVRVTKYNDGTDIPHVTDEGDWAALTTPGYCYYNNTTLPDTIKKWGALYNWYVVAPTNPKKIALAGWRVPADVDW
jgi:hypothetical protein